MTSCALKHRESVQVYDISLVTRNIYLWHIESSLCAYHLDIRLSVHEMMTQISSHNIHSYKENSDSIIPAGSQDNLSLGLRA